MVLGIFEQGGKSVIRNELTDIYGDSFLDFCLFKVCTSNTQILDISGTVKVICA